MTKKVLLTFLVIWLFSNTGSAQILKNTWIINPQLSGFNLGSANGSYTVSDLKVGSVEGNGAYAATVAVAEDGTVTATITGAAGACTVTVQNGNVTLDIAKAVQEKYGFVISK